MNDFIYDIPVTVYFGKDQLKNLTTELKKYGKNVLMTYGGGDYFTFFNHLIHNISTSSR